jgi:hypothetical protein
LRFDSEAGKGDHRHVDGKEEPYAFLSPEKPRRNRLQEPLMLSTTFVASHNGISNHEAEHQHHICGYGEEDQIEVHMIYPFRSTTRWLHSTPVISEQR